MMLMLLKEMASGENGLLCTCENVRFKILYYNILYFICLTDNYAVVAPLESFMGLPASLKVEHFYKVLYHF